MDKKILTIFLIILTLLLSVSIWSFFKYSYHERDESYMYLNGIYIKCVPVETSWNENIVSCKLPDGKTVQIIKSIIFNSTHG